MQLQLFLDLFCVEVTLSLMCTPLYFYFRLPYSVEQDNSVFLGGCPGHCRMLAASLVSTHQMPLALPKLWKWKVSPNIARKSSEKGLGKLSLVEGAGWCWTEITGQGSLKTSRLAQALILVSCGYHGKSTSSVLPSWVVLCPTNWGSLLTFICVLVRVPERDSTNRAPMSMSTALALPLYLLIYLLFIYIYIYLSTPHLDR